ncbi:MFS transporter [Zobellella iuensis]|uniref:MFS transporter n=1 Tax=Zobellella iuensis TaxID=2803811 RepID=A0ABS1QWN1_9GAMM|nr:MFS transporter [Zobellella iuensis]MBL1379264.1 MFS transporter [Zobellella iuensis]
METLKETIGTAKMPVPSSLIKQWSISVVLMVCVVLAFFDKISIAVLFSDPVFQDAMGIGADKTRLGWLMTSFLLAYGFSSIFLSVVGDLINPRTCLLVSVASWGVLMALMGLATSYEQLLALRVLLGIAEGPLFALAYSIVKQCYSAGQQARASTMFLLGTPIGAALGFPITAFILNLYGWQMTFFVMAALTLVTLAVVYFGLKGVQLRAEAQLSGPRKRMSWQQHLRNSRQLFATPAFWALCLFNVALLTYLWGLNGWLPSYLIEEKGVELKSFGALSSLPFIAMLAGEIAGAFLSDKTGKRAAQVFGGLLIAGLSLYLVLQLEDAVLAILAMSVSAMSWGFGVSSVFALLARITPAEVSATAGGIFNGFGNFAGAAAPVLMGYIVTRTGDFNLGLLFLVWVAVIGSLVLLPLIKKY